MGKRDGPVRLEPAPLESARATRSSTIELPVSDPYILVTYPNILVGYPCDSLQ